jgi:hypothetical protein
LIRAAEINDDIRSTPQAALSNSEGFREYRRPCKILDFPVSARAARMYKPIRALMIGGVNIVPEKKTDGFCEYVEIFCRLT